MADRRKRRPRAGIRPTFRIYADDVQASATVRQLAELWRLWDAPTNRVRAALSAARRIERWEMGQRVRVTKRPPPKG